MTIQVFGLPVSRGIAIGKAVLIASSHLDVAHYFIDTSATEQEIQRLRDARDTVVEELSLLQAELPGDAPPTAVKFCTGVSLQAIGRQPFFFSCACSCTRRRSTFSTRRAFKAWPANWTWPRLLVHLGGSIAEFAGQ